ncbi:hypothetical protein BKA64DRAFT_239437 [Cadophora sp. MPI-SDFR-AT-0126]|nr:hypothetical protein BKA64DRAFT_239437 [Leotiomycetes sp. MPI-SDFR-AT-0126]
MGFNTERITGDVSAPEMPSGEALQTKGFELSSNLQPASPELATLLVNRRGSDASSNNETKRTYCRIIDTLWVCSNCGEHGGMTVFVEWCPGCGHQRCHDCPLESVTRKQWIVSAQGVKSGDIFHNFYGLWNVPKYPFTSGTSRNCSASSNSKPAIGTLRNSKASHSSDLPHTGPVGDEKDEIGPSSPDTVESPASNTPSSTASTRKNSDTSDCSSTVYDSDTEPDINTAEEDEGLLDSDDSNSVEPDLERTARILDGHLISFLGPDLAARLIPRIHKRLFAPSQPDYRTHGHSGSSSSVPAQSRDAGVISNSASPMAQQSDRKGKRKADIQRQRDDDDPDEHGQPKRRKRPQARLEGPNYYFACHFWKQDPQKFGNPRSRRYQNCCLSHGDTLKRMVNDHFKTHLRQQCRTCQATNIAPFAGPSSEKCDKRPRSAISQSEGVPLELDDDMDEGDASPGCCSQPNISASDINKDQWKRIKHIAGQQGKSSEEKSKNTIDRWFEIWDVLFPWTPRPNHPWAGFDSLVSHVPVMDPTMNLLEGFGRWLAMKKESARSSELAHMQRYLEEYKTVAAEEMAPKSNRIIGWEIFPQSICNPIQTFPGEVLTGLVESSSLNAALPQHPDTNAALSFSTSEVQKIQPGSSLNNPVPSQSVYIRIQSDFFQPQSSAEASTATPSFEYPPTMRTTLNSDLSPENSATIEEQQTLDLNSDGAHGNDNDYFDMDMGFDFEQELEYMGTRTFEDGIYQGDLEL